MLYKGQLTYFFFIGMLTSKICTQPIATTLESASTPEVYREQTEEHIMSPNKLFAIYEEGYKYSYVGAESEKGKRLQIIDLFPKESGAFMKVTLAVDAAKNQLHKITILDKNGGTYSYLVTSFESNTAVAPFIFNTVNYQEVEVIDLR